MTQKDRHPRHPTKIEISYPTMVQAGTPIPYQIGAPGGDTWFSSGAPPAQVAAAARSPVRSPARSPDESLFCLIMDLVTALYPRSSDHHTMRSEAIARLRRARVDGWQYVTPTIVADALKEFSGGVVAEEHSKPPKKPLTAGISVVSGYEGGPEGYEGDSISGGDFIPHARIPERY